jgi:hypothetical protein
LDREDGKFTSFDIGALPGASRAQDQKGDPRHGAASQHTQQLSAYETVHYDILSRPSRL